VHRAPSPADRSRTPRATPQATLVMRGKWLRRRAFSGAPVTGAGGAGMAGVRKAEQNCAAPDMRVECSSRWLGSTEETLGPVLNVLAQSLDVREVFAYGALWALV